MKRLLVLALLALGLTIVVVPTASPARPGDADAQGPPCSEITNGDGGYSLEGVIDFTVFLQAPACSFVTYTFVVTDTEGNTITSVSPDAEVCTPETPGGGCVHFLADLGATGPSTVCISATTEIQGRRVADLAPNASDPICPPSSPSISLVKGGSGASGSFG
jgi:hypothetical protein